MKMSFMKEGEVFQMGLQVVNWWKLAKEQGMKNTYIDHDA